MAEGTSGDSKQSDAMKNQLIAALLLLFSLPAQAHEFLLDDLQIIHPSIPATALDATSANVYMALYNGGSEPERLLGIETAFGPATIERLVTDPDGTVRSQRMAWIDIPVGETVLLAPGEMRARVAGVSRPLVEGGELDGALVFEKRGRFAMFYMIDPVEEIDEPQAVAAVPEIDRAGDTLAIAGIVRSKVGDDAVVAPIAIVGDVAIAGWTLGDEAARTFLRKRAGAWEIVMWSGSSLLLPATMNSLGVSKGVADKLRAELSVGETALGAAFTTRFDAYPGTVLAP